MHDLPRPCNYMVFVNLAASSCLGRPIASSQHFWTTNQPFLPDMSFEVFSNFVGRLHDFSYGDTSLRRRSKKKIVRSIWSLVLPHTWLLSWQSAQCGRERKGGHSPSPFKQCLRAPTQWVKPGKDFVHPGSNIHLYLPDWPIIATTKIRRGW